MKTKWTASELKAMSREEIDKLYEIVTWYEGLRETNNETFLPLFADTHRYLVLKGGGGSGKSIFAGRKVLERAVNEPGHRFLVCRKVARTLRESCFKQLLGQLAEFYPDSGYKANKSDLTISFQNGSEIIFAGLDDVEKLKSIYNITGIWIEEASELLEGDFNQLDIRLRGKTREYQQIILSFNPISIQHWLKKRFFDRRDKRARVHESTYKDNRFHTDAGELSGDGRILLSGLLPRHVGRDGQDGIQRQGHRKTAAGAEGTGVHRPLHIRG